jgi:hypothetical protein
VNQVPASTLLEHRLRVRATEPTMKQRDVSAEERLQELFQPDTLMPSQYFDRIRRRASLDGERRLMVAILEDAIDVFRKHADARDRKRQTMFADAAAWIESGDKTWIFSFENICDVLGIDIDYLRAGLRRWHAEHGKRRGTVVAFREDSATSPQTARHAIN